MTAKDDFGTVSRWLQQLTSAAAFLEKLRLAHNDLHPRNLLLNQNLNMKLSDFDSFGEIGEDLPSAPAPYARVVNHGPNKGGFGQCGARTEQFAIGSILYFMLYGYDPYEDTCLDGDEIINRFQDMRFPELGEDTLESAEQCLLKVLPQDMLSQGHVPAPCDEASSDIHSLWDKCPSPSAHSWGRYSA